MPTLLHDLISSSACRDPGAIAVSQKQRSLDYQTLWQQVSKIAGAFVELGLRPGDRVGIYLDKRFETVIAIFAASLAGGVFVPINPQLRARQVQYILRDCNLRVLVTSTDRLQSLADVSQAAPDLKQVVLVDDGEFERAGDLEVLRWRQITTSVEPLGRRAPPVIDCDMAAILYTSGSTGSPKGVVLSHQNLVCGAKSVSQYLDNRSTDSLLAVLPLSFDAGFSQLTTAFCAGARVVLMNYLMPNGVIKVCAEEQITGLTCVAPLWIQLAERSWPEAAWRSLRYFANTGGHLPKAALDKLRASLPSARPFLMYGLTEAFRSTYLDPAEVDRRPNSIGKAIPNAEILVVGQDGKLCGPEEEGELVHRGALVAKGYWNDPQRTAERFRPAPGQPAGLPLPETAVWSGDIVRTDKEGFLYFVSRRDEMIKTSGYRVSSTEIEEVVYETGLVSEVVAIGVPDPVLGQAIILVCVAPTNGVLSVEAIQQRCRQLLPNYMHPTAVTERPFLPRSANGKIDRRVLADELADELAQKSNEESTL